MSPVWRRMPDMQPAFMQQAAYQPQGHRPCFLGVLSPEVKLDGVDDFPQTDVVLMTFFDQTFQNLIGRHAPLLSSNELDLLDGNWPTSRIDGLDINGWRTALGSRSEPDRASAVRKLDELPRISGGGYVLATLGQLLEEAFALRLSSGDLTKSR